MADRAGIFEESGPDFDVSSFVPKQSKTPKPSADVVRQVSENAKFPSREAAQPAAVAKPVKAKAQRRYRTGRNVQLNSKVDADTFKLFYEITEQQGWVAGQTIKNALEALKRELAAKK